METFYKFYNVRLMTGSSSYLNIQSTALVLPKTLPSPIPKDVLFDQR